MKEIICCECGYDMTDDKEKNVFIIYNPKNNDEERKLCYECYDEILNEIPEDMEDDDEFVDNYFWNKTNE